MEEDGAGDHLLEEGITAFVYRVHRPFHPQRLWDLLQKPFPGIFRAKGFFWLATRMNLAGGLSIAGSECEHAPAGEWWAATATREHADPSEIPQSLKKEWKEPFGDRRQAISFIGKGFDSAGLRSHLDRCLLTDSEMAGGEHAWATMTDPFPEGSVEPHRHECGHEGCCHH
jgi:G3E family GTPase